MTRHTDKHDEPMKKKIVTITKNGTNPAYQGARKGVDRLASTLNITVEHLVPAVPDSIEEQIGFLEHLLISPPDAILLAPANISALDATLAKIKAAGIPVIMFVGHTAEDYYVTFVGSDDYAMTREVARALCRELNGKGRIGIIDGNPLGINFDDRAKGFRDGIAEFPEIELVGTRIGNFLREPAHEAMLSLLDEQPAIDGVLAANDFMSLGVIDALKERGVHPKIGSVNATPDGIAGIKSGDIIATAAFNAMAMGCIALLAALRRLDGESVPKTILLPVEIVDKSNFSQWDLPYETRRIPTWEEATKFAHRATAR